MIPLAQHKGYKMNLYELQDQLLAIDNILADNTDPETDDILESAKEELLKQIGDKVENVLNYISDCKGKAEQLKAEETRLAKKRKSFERRVDYLRNMIFFIMKSNNKTKETYGTWDCSIVKTAPKIIVDDEHWLPQCCIKTTTTVDKTALKSYLWEGKYTTTVDGKEVLVAHEENSESLRIA